MNLQEAKKFYLIDASQIPSAELSGERLQPLAKRELHKLDRLMLEIANSEDLSQLQKVNEYNKVLSEFQYIEDKVRGHAINAPVPVAPTEPNVQIKDSYDPLLGISQPYHNKAKQLLSLLHRSQDFDISSTGEIILKKEKIPDSNISDILNKAVNPRIKLKNVAGWDKFHSFLMQQHPPKSLLAAKLQKDIKRQSSRTPSQTLIRSPIDTTPIGKWLGYKPRKTLATKL